MEILLVEDSLAIIKGLEYSFKQENYNLSIATNLKQASKIIEDKKIDLIILDIGLPDGNGLDFYEDTIKILNISTIFLTAQDDEETVVKGLNLGADDYITKPFSTKELFARINKIVLRNKKNTIIKIGNIKFDQWLLKIFRVRPATAASS